MKRVYLVHWNADEAALRASRLRQAGYEVAGELFRGPDSLRALRAAPPAAVVIDLSRLPSHGLAVALALRQMKATRGIPLVFAGGEAEKVARVREQLPDAVFTDWGRIRSALTGALAHPPASPVVPRSVFEPYAGRPLALKLGIKPHMLVSLVGAPPGFESTLEGLPAAVRLLRKPEAGVVLTVWFVRSQKELRTGIGRMAAQLTEGSLWIAWPKKGSSLATDLTQQDVRETGLAAGLVDYKICAIDDTWSGLLFTRRKVSQR
jgi:CheY-like chemotaxis protein